MGGKYKGMAGFEGNRFWNNTYQAIRVINGSDWAKGADWLYAEWCTGEREFYNVTSDKRQINNIVDKADADLLQKLSTLTEALGKCAGKSCNDISFAEIAHVRKSDASYVKCHNPPDMPSQEAPDLSSDVWNDLTGTAERKKLCMQLVSNGFPYSDDQLVSKKELMVWEFCLNEAEI